MSYFLIIIILIVPLIVLILNSYAIYLCFKDVYNILKGRFNK